MKTVHLIVLAKVNRINLLSALADEFVIPYAVATEITAGPEDDPAHVWLSTQNPPQVVNVPEPQAELLAWDLGAGETAVLSYALHHPRIHCA